MRNQMSTRRFREHLT